jgi:hypothetical protein
LPLGDLIILFTIFSLVFGLSSMGIGAMTIKARGRINAALREGMVIEVQAPAFRDRTGRKGQSWNIGPISMMQTPELQGMLAEGAPTSVVCIPDVKAALSVNGVPLKRGAAITAPPNLAAMATVQAPAPYMPPMQAQYPAMQMQPAQAPPFQPAGAPAIYAPPPQPAPFPQPQQNYPAQMQAQPYPMQGQQPMPYPQQAPQPYPGPNMPQPYPGQTQPYPQQAPPDIPRK